MFLSQASAVTKKWLSLLRRRFKNGNRMLLWTLAQTKFPRYSLPQAMISKALPSTLSMTIHPATSTLRYHKYINIVSSELDLGNGKAWTPLRPPPTLIIFMIDFAPSEIELKATRWTALQRWTAFSPPLKLLPGENNVNWPFSSGRKSYIYFPDSESRMELGRPFKLSNCNVVSPFPRTDYKYRD